MGLQFQQIQQREEIKDFKAYAEGFGVQHFSCNGSDFGIRIKLRMFYIHQRTTKASVAIYSLHAKCSFLCG